MTAKQKGLTALQPLIVKAKALAARDGHNMAELDLSWQSGGYWRWQGVCTTCRWTCTATNFEVYGMPRVVYLPKKCKRKEEP